MKCFSHTHPRDGRRTASFGANSSRMLPRYPLMTLVPKPFHRDGWNLTPDVKVDLEAQVERVEALQKRLKRIVPYLFPHLDGAHEGERMQNFRKAWATACRKAGVPGRLRHDFRRTAVRNMERSGVSRSVATKLTGHKTEAVYRRYAIVSDADLKAAALRLSGDNHGDNRPRAVDAEVVSL